MAIQSLPENLKPFTLEDWKAGSQSLGNVPTYAPAEEEDETSIPQQPLLQVCTAAETADGKPCLSLPAAFRSKWAEDPARKAEWATEIEALEVRPSFQISHYFPER